MWHRSSVRATLTLFYATAGVVGACALSELPSKGAGLASRDNVGRSSVGAPTTAENVIWRSERVCGLNCVYLILRAYGKAPDYIELRDELLKERLTSLLDIKTAARKHGLDLRLGRLTPQLLEEVDKPAIAHLESVDATGASGGHFVAVLEVDTERVRFVDGSTAELREVPLADFQRDWTGFAAVRVETDSTAKLVIVFGAAFAAVGCLTSLARHRSLRDRQQSPAHFSSSD